MNAVSSYLLGLPLADLELLCTFNGINDISTLIKVYQSRGEMRNVDAELLSATNKGDYYTVLTLLRGSDANVNVADSYYSYTPLMNAVRHNHAYIVQYLLARGANVNAVNKLGLTPLMYASRNGNTRILRTLLENGADPSVINTDSKTALDLALNDGVRELLKNTIGITGVIINNIADLNKMVETRQITPENAAEWLLTYRLYNPAPVLNTIFEARVAKMRNIITASELENIESSLRVLPMETDVVLPPEATDCANNIDIYSQEDWTVDNLPEVKIQVLGESNPQTYCFKRDDLLHQINDPNFQWRNNRNVYYELKLYALNLLFRNSHDQLVNLITNNNNLIAVRIGTDEVRMMEKDLYVLYTPETWNNPELVIRITHDDDMPSEEYRFMRNEFSEELTRVDSNGNLVYRVNPTQIKLPVINIRVNNTIDQLLQLITSNTRLNAHSDDMYLENNRVHVIFTVDVDQ